MTFNEAITKRETLTHKEVYERAINALGGLDAIIPYIPFTLKEIQTALANHDEYLNTLPLRHWDYASNNIKGLCYRKANINCMSLSQGVCLLKEAARQWAERGM